jgi:PleD family two-component response regulator
MSTIGPASLPLRILAVDANEQEVAAALAPPMRWLGAELRLAADRASALQIAADFLPQVVLLDLGLPRLEGFHLARLFRQLERLRDVWLVAGSPFGDVAFRTLAKDAGFDDFVLKPYTSARFQGLFDQAFQHGALQYGAVQHGAILNQAGLVGGRVDPAQLSADAAQPHGPLAPTDEQLHGFNAQGVEPLS